MSNVRIVFLTVFVALCACAYSEPKTFTIVHTNDMHSRIQGFPAEQDYTPLSTNDDSTFGGWARIATAIREVRAERKNPVLVLCAGDFLMGTLFHMVSREESIELRLLKDMGYDAVGLGNHEFDLMPDSLARILASAQAKGGMPQVLLSNVVFSSESAEDDSLAEAFSMGLVKPYIVKVEDGVRIGIFAIIGANAAEVAPFASPVEFRQPAEVAREMVKRLREDEKVDVVVCLSHSGLSSDPEKSEDVALAREVEGIDVIVSGHTHTKMEKPILVGGTIIVQAWEWGREVGVLDFAWDAGKVSLVDWRAVPIDDSIPGDRSVQARIDSFISAIDNEVLGQYGLSYREVIAETSSDLALPLAESGLGNMATDMIRWYVDRYDSDPNDPSSKVAFAVESNGILGEQIARGKTGRILTADLFRVLPFGIGLDDTMGYPLITVYLTGSEIKKALEVVTSVFPLKGSDYFLQISGARFTYNPHRMIFDRVTGIWMGDEEQGYVPLDYSRGNKTLYRVAANYYNSAFLKIIGSFTFGILDIVPKDKNGTPIEDLADARVDADKAMPGIQELKEWVGLMEYVRGFPDSNGDGIGDIPVKYQAGLGRNVSEPSWNPANLLSRGTFVTWVTVGAAVLVLALIAGIVILVVFLVRRAKRRRLQLG